MGQLQPLVAALIWLTLTLALTQPCVAQGNLSPHTEPAAISSAGVETKLAALDAASELDDATKAAFKEKYAQALTLLKSAQAFTSRAKDFSDTIGNATSVTAALTAQRQTLAASDPRLAKVDEFRTAKTLLATLDRENVQLIDLQSQLQQLERDTNTIRSRPLAINARLNDLQSELVTVRTQLGNARTTTTSQDQVVERTLLQAREKSLRAEYSMLTQEQLSQPARESLIAARRELITEQINRHESYVQALNQRANLLRTDVAEKLATRVKTATSQTTSHSPTATQLSQQVETMSHNLVRSTQQLKRLSLELTSVNTDLASLTRAFERINAQTELGGFESSFSEILVDFRQRLPNAETIINSLETHRAELRDIQLSQFALDDQSDEDKDLEKKASGDPALKPLLNLRSDLSERLRTNYQALTSVLASLDASKRAYLSKTRQVRKSMDDMLFWQKSSQPLNHHILGELPESLRWVFRGERVAEVGQALYNIVLRHPIKVSAIFVIIALILIQKNRITSHITELGKRIRRIAGDHYLYTVQAFLLSCLLALPIPLILFCVARALQRQPDASDWMLGLAAGLKWGVRVTTGACILFTLARPEGVGVAHFGWAPAAAKRLRQTLVRLVLAYIPALLLLSSTLFENSPKYFDGIGRIAFILAHLCCAWVMHQAFDPETGIFQRIIKSRPDGVFARTRWLWYALGVGTPLGISLMAADGYLVTALSLSLASLGTLVIVASGWIIYNMVLRWFIIRERKLALAEALEARRQRQEPVPTPAESAENPAVLDPEEAELDLETIGLQTRSLLRTLNGVAIVLVLYTLWTSALPIDELLGDITILGVVSLLGALQTVLIVAITVIVTRNIPGLLELSGLRATGMESGTRYAVATISQYVAIAIGFALLSQTLGVDWKKLSWIAAALSVGIGFGLQEVVANFISGIIILFERPIRVGDIVTIDGIDGVVSRIQIRATTITNWDRKEFVVPNKNFVTGTLLNWTLSSPVSRSIIQVGVAYGSDTEKARQILLDVANDHPVVLDDPAPLATFEAFDDSSLRLLLRAYFPNMDSRVLWLTELHSEIDKRFKQAGIEIAFPQQDLHLRSVDPDVQLGARPKS